MSIDSVVSSSSAKASFRATGARFPSITSIRTVAVSLSMPSPMV
jgi:hypothetical protein